MSAAIIIRKRRSSAPAPPAGPRGSSPQQALAPAKKPQPAKSQLRPAAPSRAPASADAGTIITSAVAAGVIVLSLLAASDSMAVARSILVPRFVTPGTGDHIVWRVHTKRTCGRAPPT